MSSRRRFPSARSLALPHSSVPPRSARTRARSPYTRGTPTHAWISSGCSSSLHDEPPAVERLSRSAPVGRPKGLRDIWSRSVFLRLAVAQSFRAAVFALAFVLAAGDLARAQNL